MCWVNRENLGNLTCTKNAFKNTHNGTCLQDNKFHSEVPLIKPPSGLSNSDLDCKTQMQRKEAFGDWQ